MALPISRNVLFFANSLNCSYNFFFKKLICDSNLSCFEICKLLKNSPEETRENPPLISIFFRYTDVIKIRKTRAVREIKKFTQQPRTHPLSERNSASILRNVVMPVHFMSMITTLISQLPKRKVKGYIVYLMLDVFFKVFDNSCQNSHRGGNRQDGSLERMAITPFFPYLLYTPLGS